MIRRPIAFATTGLCLAALAAPATLLAADAPLPLPQVTVPATPQTPAEQPAPPATATPEAPTATAQTAAQGPQDRRPEPVAFAASPGSVIIADFSFSPATLTI